MEKAAVRHQRFQKKVGNTRVRIEMNRAAGIVSDIQKGGPTNHHTERGVEGDNKATKGN